LPIAIQNIDIWCNTIDPLEGDSVTMIVLNNSTLTVGKIGVLHPHGF
jgi:hypothetical protein